jgi:DNA-binding transcriptional MerR regulator
MAANGRGTLSIGQVLSALKAEFHDISVSKIRFLESEGLLAPERTASGYRKFSEADLERLRTILRLQRDAFMPLKVIRERLAAIDAGVEAPPAAAPAPAAPAPATFAPTLAAVPAAPPPKPVEEDEFARPEPLRLTEADLADATGLATAEIKQLLDFGVLNPSGGNGSTYYDAEDAEVAKLAKMLLGLGLDVRHLRSMKRSAEQDAELFQQLLTPVLRNRRPEVREQAAKTLSDLTRASRRLRQVYVRRSLRSLIDGER